MRMLSGLLVYTKEHAHKNGAYIDQMLAEAKTLGIKLDLVYREELFIGIENGQPFVRGFHGEKIIRNFAIVRCIDPLFTRQLELVGFKTFNSAIVSELCNDKAKTAQIATMLGIPMADTIYLAENQAVPLAPPFVTKTRNGSGGIGVELVQDQTQFSGGGQMIAQQLVMQGKDVRAFILGKEVIGTVLRTSETDFRANLSLGGHAEIVTLGEKEKAIVSRLTQMFEFGLVGIDFIYQANGDPLLNEIEDVVGSRSLISLSDINVVQLYLQFIKSKLLG